MNLGEEDYLATMALQRLVPNWLNGSSLTIQCDLPGKITNAPQQWQLSIFGHGSSRLACLPLYDPNGYYFYAPSPILGLAEGGTGKIQTDNMYHQVSFTFESGKRLDYTWISITVSSRPITTGINKCFTTMMWKAMPMLATNIRMYTNYYKENYYNFNIYTEYTHQFNQSMIFM